MKNIIIWLNMLFLPITAACTGTSESLFGPESEQLSVELLPEQLLVFDDSIPVAAGSHSEWLPEDIDEITEDADVIFLGRVVDYKERLFLHNLESSSWPRYWVYDGIVLQADDLLLGEMPDPDTKITLAVRALTELHDGTVHSRHIDREISIFGEGIRSIGSAESPQYLVYAGPSPPGTRWHELGLYWILSSGGAVRVYSDGSLGAGNASPFAKVWDANAEGEYDWVFPYDLQDAREAAELAKSGIEDTSGIPEEQTTNLDEESEEEESDGDSAEVDSDAETTLGADSSELESGEGDDAGTGSEGSAELGDGNNSDLREDDVGDQRTPGVGLDTDSDETEDDSGQSDLGSDESLKTNSRDSDDDSSEQEIVPETEDESDAGSEDEADDSFEQDVPGEEGAPGTGDEGVRTPSESDVVPPGG